MNFSFKEHHILFFLHTDHKTILFLFTPKNKPNHRVYKIQLFLVKFTNLHIVWTEAKKLSLPDLLSPSLTTTTQDEDRLRTVAIPNFIKFFMTLNHHTHPIQCHYAVSNEYFNTITPDTTKESPHFAKYLQIKDNCFKVQLKNDFYLPVSYQEIKTKAQPFEQLQQNKKQEFKQNHSLLETYPIIQHTDVNLNSNKTGSFTKSTQNANYSELINTIKFSLPALDNL